MYIKINYFMLANPTHYVRKRWNSIMDNATTWQYSTLTLLHYVKIELIRTHPSNK